MVDSDATERPMGDTLFGLKDRMMDQALLDAPKTTVAAAKN